MSPEPCIAIAPGARAAEAFLLSELTQLQSASRADWSLLARPVRVIVPSRSLRDHLAAQLVHALGGGAAGVQIQTLRAVAYEVLERGGEGARGGQALVPVLVRRFAAEEAPLAGALGAFDDGFGVALASVNDLLDAGLDPWNAESALECLADASSRTSPPAAARAAALVRVAARVAAALESGGCEPRAGFFRRAREQLERDPALLPTRALYLHGWADVTGVQLDLLEALVRLLAGQVVLDHPPAVSGTGDEGIGERWTERLRLRLLAPVREIDGASAPVALDAIEAPGPHAEARAVAECIRRLLDRGERPESIGIVLRDSTPYRHALYAQLTRLAVPFSGSAASLGPTGRRIAALLELIERADGSTADRWLDAEARFGRTRSADLRLAFHGIGVGRLRDVAALDLDALLEGDASYPLPVRRGLTPAAATADPEREVSEVESEPNERAPAAVLAAHAGRRKISRAMLAEAIAAAGALRTRLEALRSAPSLGAKLAALRRLLARELGWLPSMPAAGTVYHSLAQLEQELGAETPLSADEGLVLLRRALGGLGEEPLGGRGGGVALLSALEARGRTFAQLFVMGLSRDVFPRLVREDPLLPDSLRRALEVVLPDVPIKQRGVDEERYLFAALCAAAPAVTLSWPTLSDDGKERAVSPLVEALRTGGLSATAAAPVLAERAGLRPALEHAIRAGIAHEARRAEQALALTLDAPLAAQARVAALRELDSAASRGPLGPFFGFVGRAQPGDPRQAELSITRLEGLARCAWQAFLERVLGLEPPPDALAELPDASPLLVGNVVHAVLEELVRDAGGAVGASIEEARVGSPLRIPWPAPAELERKLRHAAAHAAREEGIVLRGFAVHLARRARPLLERIRTLEWGDGAGPAVLGAELEGRVEVARAAGPPRSIRFRADRGDLADDGGLLLVDYKTGAPITDAKTDATRSEHLLAQIAQGRRLQGPAYARAGSAGRYVFAKEGVEDANACVEIAHGDGAAGGRFDEAARDLLAAFEAGAFPPRLLSEKRSGQGPACARCDVAEACLLGESGSAERLAAWLGQNEDDGEGLAEAPRAALRLLLRLEKK